MILADKHIKEALKTGEIVVHPFDEGLINPNSLDVRLGNKVVVWDWDNISHIDPTKKDQPFIAKNPNAPVTKEIDISQNDFFLAAGEPCLATTLEYTETVGIDTGIMPKLEGKSSIGRCNMDVHATAGVGDDGFCGYWTLELFNKNRRPILLTPGMKIAQLLYFGLSCKPAATYQTTGRYNNSKGEDSPIVSKGV